MHHSHREIFFKHVAQTSPTPLGIEIQKAEGVYIYDISGKKYLDFISGIAVSSVGHQHPQVKQAIVDQLNKYAHIMVYGETIQHPQTEYAQLLTQHLPSSLDCIYFVNSGAEAIEGAMKLAKGYTGRPEIVAFENAYHGSTQGALSIMGNEWLKSKYRPLLPAVKILKWQDNSELEQITSQTAAVFIEPIRAESGIQIPDENFLQALNQRCKETGTLLVFDEIQTGFGRTGKLFAFQHFGIVPDILVLGKAMGGGLPIGAFIASHSLMETFTHHPLGHLTTFGGNAVCVASALATLNVILQQNLIDNALRIEQQLKNNLVHTRIQFLRIKGAMGAIQLESSEIVMKTIELAINKGLIIDWFLFAPDCIRLAPPLTITSDELQKGIEIILECLDNV
ncbi:MAG: aspartate aminotransferase family protein [Bacteroidia bacterium]|nr:MAG: aspartate aminotransferase family protein [Bacteroidia bacterium]